MLFIYIDTDSCTITLSDSCYNYTSLDHSIYIVNTTAYSNIFSNNKTYPDYSRSTLTTLSQFDSTPYESFINNYRTDPDVNRNDSNGDNCVQSSILYYPDDGQVYTNWEYRFNKALVNEANIMGLNILPSISPDNGWLTWTENITYIIFSGIVTNNSHAVEYSLTITATDQTSNALVDTITVKFTIQPNSPPVIEAMSSKIIEVSDCLNWTYGVNLVQDYENDTFTSSLLFDDSSSIPSWLLYDFSDYSFYA